MSKPIPADNSEMMMYIYYVLDVILIVLIISMVIITLLGLPWPVASVLIYPVLFFLDRWRKRAVQTIDNRHRVR